MPGGRPRKPTRAKILAGTFRADRDGPRAASRNPLLPPCKSAPPCPRWLHAYAREEWKRACKALVPSGVLTRADLTTLAAYCQAWAEFRLATEELDRDGRTVSDDKGNARPHPAVGRQRSAWQAVRQFAALFGLDPSSRSRMPAVPVEARDELELFLGEEGG